MSIKSIAGAVAFGVFIAGAGAASAAPYFINPFARLGDVTDGGIQSNGPTSGEASVGPNAYGSVDLSTGQSKAYVNLDGIDTLGIAAGIFGERVGFSANSSVDFSYAFDGSVFAQAIDPAYTDYRQVQIVASLYVFDSETGATASNFASKSGALVAKQYLFNLVNWSDEQNLSFDESLFGSTGVVAGRAYDVFAGLSVAGLTNGAPVNITLDFSHTGTFGIAPAPGVTYASASGALLASTGVLAEAGAVPEPASWAMMIMGFGLAGGAMRRRRASALAA